MFFSVAPVVVKDEFADGVVAPVVVDNVVFVHVAVVATAIGVDDDAVVVPLALFVVHGTIAPVDVENVIIVVVYDNVVVDFCLLL